MAGKVFGIDDPVTGVTAFTLERQRFETVLVLCFGELRAPVDEFLNTSRGVPHRLSGSLQYEGQNNRRGRSRRQSRPGRSWCSILYRFIL